MDTAKQSGPGAALTFEDRVARLSLTEEKEAVRKDSLLSESRSSIASVEISEGLKERTPCINENVGGVGGVVGRISEKN